MPAQMSLRDLARQLFDAGVAAVDPARALAKSLAAHPFPTPDPDGRLILIAIGKAAPAMMSEALRHVPMGTPALVVTHHQNTTPVPGASVLHAGHPVPDAAGARAAQAVIDVLQDATAQDRVVALISGGGSALVPAPVEGVSLENKSEVSRVLLAAGLDITQMNLVRQAVSRLKGGGFLRLAAPAPVTGYLLSDVIGDDLRVIASGPTVAPIGTIRDAHDLLQAQGLFGAMPPSVQTALTRSDPTEPLPEVANHLIASNRHALDAMAEAVPPNWQARIVNDRLEGDVDEAARKIVQEIGPVTHPTALIFGGETTVVLTGTGRGGRNQELALRVAAQAGGQVCPWLFLSGGTDGRDGPTDAAGGIVDAGTFARITASGADPDALLANNDSHAALAAAGDLLMTDATGTNVADVQVLLLTPET